MSDSDSDGGPGLESILWGNLGEGDRPELDYMPQVQLLTRRGWVLNVQCDSSVNHASHSTNISPHLGYEPACTGLLLCMQSCCFCSSRAVLLLPLSQDAVGALGAITNKTGLGAALRVCAGALTAPHSVTALCSAHISSLQRPSSSSRPAAADQGGHLRAACSAAHTQCCDCLVTCWECLNARHLQTTHHAVGARTKQ